MTEAFGPIHPGEMLREEFMTELGWDVDKVAEESGIESDVIAHLIAEEADITEDISKNLAVLLIQLKDFGSDCSMAMNQTLVSWKKQMKLQGRFQKFPCMT